MKSAPVLKILDGKLKIRGPVLFFYLRNSCKKCEPTAMTTHNFDNKCTRVRICGGVDIINRFANAMQRRRCANSQVREGHVVVDGPNEADDLQVSMGASFLRSDFS
jgi:hypothetical protein